MLIHEKLYYMFLSLTLLCTSIMWPSQSIIYYQVTAWSYYGKFKPICFMEEKTIELRWLLDSKISSSNPEEGSKMVNTFTLYTCVWALCCTLCWIMTLFSWRLRFSTESPSWASVDAATNAPVGFPDPSIWSPSHDFLISLHNCLAWNQVTEVAVSYQ